MNPLPVVITDGGRRAAGYTTRAKGDCVARSIAIVTGRPYREIFEALTEGKQGQRASSRTGKQRGTADTGIHTSRKWFDDYMIGLGFAWVPTMRIGSGCKVHLRAGEIPMSGRLVVALSRHMTAVVDGTVFDVYDPSRGGNRCVYGYYVLKGGK